MDPPTLASHYTFNGQDDQYTRLLDSSKVAKETIKLLQEPVTTSGFLRSPGNAQGYIAIICFTLHPSLLMIIPSTDSPSAGLPLSCRTLQANSETARVTWIKTKYVHRVKELAHLELLQNVRRSICGYCNISLSSSENAWYDVGLQESLRVVNQWVDWMDQDPYLPNGHLKPELHKKSSAAIELIEQHDKETPKREWLKDFMRSHQPATSASTGEEGPCRQQ